MDTFEPKFDLEKLWGGLLSEEVGKVRRAWESLSDEEATPVMAHLKVMAVDPERAEVQRGAAEFAIAVLQSTD